MKKSLITALLMTAATTVLLGVVYPLVMTALAQVLLPRQANGELIRRGDEVIGSRLIGQPFTSGRYFHSRPSAAGYGYDAEESGGSNLAPTNAALVRRVNSDAAALARRNPGMPVPIDLVTTSASGLDPDITPAAAYFQVPRVARVRGISESQLRALVRAHVEGRQYGFLGEPRVNVLELNLALDQEPQQHKK